MDDALGVRGVQRVGNLDPQVEQFVDLQRLAAEAVLEGFSFQLLHHDKGLAFVLANLVHRADIRVVQRRGGPRLAPKTFEELAVVDEFFGQEFERHAATELGVLRLIDHSHCAAAEASEHAIV
jgi:hypothetical protein